MLEFDLCHRHIFNYNGTEKKVVVYYTLTRGTEMDRLPDVDTNPTDGINDIAANIAQWTEEAWRRYLDYGFGDPLNRNNLDVYVYNKPGLLGWCCSDPHYYFYNAPHAVTTLSAGGDPKNGAEVSFHEMFHAAQSGGDAAWITEGTASSMTDHINLPVDLDNQNLYLGQVSGYLGSGMRQSLTTHDYGATLWWTYFLEQAGTITDEPNRGIDAMREFWKWTSLGVDGLTILDNMLRGLPNGRTFESTWIDFTVANYVKELTGPGVPAKYRYQDELQAGAPDYPAVSLDLNRALSVGDGVIATADIQSWAARYYQIRPDPSVPILNIEFHEDTNRRLGYTLLLIRNDDIVQEIRQVGPDFVRSLANNNYDRVVVIVTGLSDYANYRYSINGVQPVFNIVDPLSGRQAQAGDPLAPEKILIKVEVLSPLDGGTPVAGIDPNAFTITIGNQIVQPAQRISSAYIQGQYWMLIRAPTQLASGNYNLRVDFGTAMNDTEFRAVNYATRADADNTLIIDRSNSMNDFLKIQAAKDAARLYVDSWRNGDKIGVVSFNEDATVDLTLRDWDDTSRNDALNIINGLTAGGNTSIGDGLVNGLAELIARGDEAHDWTMVVLSDGMENEPLFIQDFMNTYTTRKNNEEKVPRVYTIALGPDADRARLEKLARDTGGTYHYASEPASASALLSVSSTTGLDLPNDLAEIYRVIGEAVARQHQIYAARSVISHGETVSHRIHVEGDASEAIFVLNWSDIHSAELEVQLSQPDGNPVQAPTLVDRRHLVWRIPIPMSGEWLMTVSRQRINPLISTDGHLLVEAAVKSDLTMDVFLGLSVDDRLIGRPMPILVSLSDSQAIRGATVNVSIIDPTGGAWNLALHDDGLHNDGDSGDGFYGNTFYGTYSEGSYVAIVNAQGTSTLAGDFRRRLRTSFNIDRAPDADQDGVPDWADANPGQADGTEDPDQDGLNNLDEFQQGTDPLNTDTDNGGESDGSEVSHGTDPQDPGDDQIQCMLDFQAMNVLQESDEPVNPQASVLLFTVNPDHDHFIVWRATDPAGPWQLLNDQAPPTGQYIDQQVTLGVTYYYRLQAVDQDGHKSCILGPRRTTPKADSVPPEGIVLINNGAEFTYSPNVLLTLLASSDTVEMIVSNNPDFVDAVWEPYQTGKPWQLAQSLGQATVFVKYRDAAGNESSIAVGLIEVKQPADLAVTKTASPDPVTEGNNVTYTLTIANNGPGDATGVTATDTLPAGVTFVSANPSQGSCEEASGVIMCDLGNLAYSVSATITIIVNPASCGAITNQATVSGNEVDPTSPNIASVGTTITCPVGLNIRPEAFPNRIRLSGGPTLVHVAILSNSSFDAPNAVDRSSLTFGHSGNENSLHRQGRDCWRNDVNRDGLLDLVCNFVIRRTGFQPADTVGILKGMLLNGTSFEAQDSVIIIEVSDDDDL